MHEVQSWIGIMMLAGAARLSCVMFFSLNNNPPLRCDVTAEAQHMGHCNVSLS